MKGVSYVKRFVAFFLFLSFFVITVYAQSDAEKAFWDALGMNPPEATESYSEYYLSGYQDGYDAGFKAGVESVIQFLSKESEETHIVDEHQEEEPYNVKNSDLKPLSRPVNKKIFRYSTSSDSPHSTLEIETPYGDVDYYFVVNNLIDTSNNAKFYLYSNSTIEVNIAPGTYEIYYACGSQWYGLQYLFGDQSKCRKFKDTFTFTEECGWTVEMNPVSNGNLSSELVDVSEFPK